MISEVTVWLQELSVKLTVQVPGLEATKVGLLAFAFGKIDTCGFVVVQTPPETETVPEAVKVKSQPIVSGKMVGNAKA